MKQSTSIAQVAKNLLNVLQGYTKGIRFLLVMFLTLTVSAEVWGADITFTGDDIRSSFSFGTNYGEATFSSDGFSIYSSSGYGNTSGQFRVAKNAKLTISSSVGNITKVVIKVTSTSYKLNDTNNKISWSSTTGTYTASASGSTSVTFNNSSTSIARITSIQIFYSSSTSYTVTYHANGATSGTVPTDDTKYNSGATVTVKLNSGSLAKTGYTFSGWNTKADGTGTTYTAGTGTFTISTTTILYAKWTANTYTVTWIANGDTKRTDIGVAYNTSKIAPTVSPTPCGDVIAGWTDAENGNYVHGTSTLYSGATPSIQITGNKTFYAVFADYEQ